jgi:diacylglycerol kinase
MNLSRLLRSFAVGFQGLAHAVAHEQNLRIHCVIAVAVVGAGVWLGLATWEWIAVVLCIGMVIGAECMNTALERLADRVTTEHDPLIKQAKDCGSAAVLVLAMMAAVVGVVVFAPKLWSLAGW